MFSLLGAKHCTFPPTLYYISIFIIFDIMNTLLIATATICLSFTPMAAINEEYCNGLFHYCIEYPADFKGQGEANNGDGQTFVSADGARILAFGKLAIDADGEETIQSSFKIVSSSLEITTKVVKPSWYIVSGKDLQGNIVYRKTIMKTIDYKDNGRSDTKVLQTLMIIYPPSLEEKYKDYCAYIAKSL